MSKYKQIETALEKYTDKIIYISKLEEELEYLEKDAGVSGISYEGVSGGETNNISDIVADTVLSNEEKKHYIKHQIKCLQKEVDILIEALSKLENVERNILARKYILNKTWHQVAELMGIKERQCRNIRVQAIKKMEEWI